MVFMGTQLTLPFALAVSIHPHELISDPQQRCGMFSRRGAVSELIASTFYSINQDCHASHSQMLQSCQYS